MIQFLWKAAPPPKADAKPRSNAKTLQRGFCNLLILNVLFICRKILPQNIFFVYRKFFRKARWFVRIIGAKTRRHSGHMRILMMNGIKLDLPGGTSNQEARPLALGVRQESVTSENILARGLGGHKTPLRLSRLIDRECRPVSMRT